MAFIHTTERACVRESKALPSLRSLENASSMFVVCHWHPNVAFYFVISNSMYDRNSYTWAEASCQAFSWLNR